MCSVWPCSHQSFHLISSSDWWRHFSLQLRETPKSSLFCSSGEIIGFACQCLIKLKYAQLLLLRKQGTLPESKRLLETKLTTGVLPLISNFISYVLSTPYWNYFPYVIPMAVNRDVYILKLKTLLMFCSVAISFLHWFQWCEANQTAIKYYLCQALNCSVILLRRTIILGVKPSNLCTLSISNITFG